MILLPPDDDQMAVDDTPWGPGEEAAIISLALDHPEFFGQIVQHVNPDLFNRIEAKYLIAELLSYYQQYETVPTRELFRSRIGKKLTVDEPFEEIMAIIDRPSNPRDVPILKGTLHEWAKQRTFGLLYSQASIDAFKRRDYAKLQEIFEKAGRIQDVGQSGFWLFQNFERVFEEKAIEHISTGWPTLDKELNNGGPSPGEVLVYLAATGVGKCGSIDTKIIEENLFIF